MGFRFAMPYANCTYELNSHCRLKKKGTKKMAKIRRLFSIRTELLVLAVVSLVLQLYASDIDAKLISTLAGTGSDGFSGDGGIATNAQLDPERECFRVAVDPNGDVYVADV